MGKKSSKSKSTSDPWAPAQPILLGAGNSINSAVSGNADNLKNIESGLTGMLPGLQQQVANTGGQLQPGFGYINDTLNGSYLNSNPYTLGMTHQAGQDAGNAVNAAFSRAGRTGSDNHATQLAKGVDQAENSILFQNYQNERGQQTAAAAQLPGMTNAEYAGYAPLAGITQLAGQLPYYGAQAASGVGGLYNGYGTQTQTTPGGWMGGLLGAASNMFSFSPIKLSDRRLKTNIKKVGEASDGLGRYTWNWKTDPHGPPISGVIADEVEKLRPWAFVPNFRGEYGGVNYATLGSLA